MTDLPTLKRRRGTARASLTRLITKVAELESAKPDPSITSYAQQYIKRLETLDASFKTHHLAIMDVLEDEGQLEAEQEALAKHDDGVMELSLRLQALSVPTPPISTATETHPPPDRAIVERRLAQLQVRLLAVNEDVNTLTGDPEDIHLVYLHQEQLSDLKRELSDVRNELPAITADMTDSLCTAIQRQDKMIFEMSVKVKKLLYNPSPAPESAGTLRVAPEPRGVKLPKIDVPKFDGDLLHWQTFWEQFSIAIHSRSDLSTTEKLVYLRHSLKDGSAKTVIERLSHSGDQYEEAIASLRSRYARPRLIHQAHVRKIYEAASLKEGSGKELRYLHDTVQQHLRALKAMGNEPSGSFITSLLELKLDKNTMFEWQKTSQDSTDMPHYTKLLEFLNLRAQASETCSTQSKKHPRYEPTRKPVTSFTASATDAVTNCYLCKTQKHPLYIYPQFKSLPHERMLATVRSNNLCLNCLRPGHFSKNCRSNNRCRRCQKPHHTLLHSETKASHGNKEHTPPAVEQQHSATLAVTPTIPSNAQSGSTGNALLITCQLLINAPDGSHIRARGLLKSGSSTSFISERMAQSLHLPRSTRNVKNLWNCWHFPHYSITLYYDFYNLSHALTQREVADFSHCCALCHV